MPRTFETTVYKFSELSEDAQKKALEQLAEQADRFFEPSFLSEWFRDELGRKFLPWEDLEWSLGYSQGDGVAFYGTIDQLDDLLRSLRKLSKFRPLKDANGEWRVDVSLSRNSYGYHYSHWNTMQVDVEWTFSASTDPTPKQSALMDELEGVVREYVQTTSRELERAGYADIEYQTSDPDKLREDAEANDMEFNADGTIA